MSSVDNRIVNMQFNNKGFESGVATTLNSLKKLNESLKMKDASKGLTDISGSLNKVNGSGLSGLSRGVEAVTSKFSALGVVATTALVNITNKAVNAGLALAKSLTVEPIMTGFSEYETKMGSIQTILTNTAHEGKTLDDVTAVLDDLNKYSDQTIYNFAEMTSNIGRFTAAGVGLEKSAMAIKGIANLAAASGSSSQQASTAMYQLSQALAAGKVSLMDWNSVVNAGMGGKLFQDALIRTSEVLGTNAEDMIKKYGSFRESLTKGEWLTSEVLTETLKQLAGAYTEAELIEQGYTESQAKDIVKLAETATAAATEVKTVTQLIDTMKESVQSGWAESWEHVIGDKDQATKTLTAVKDAFDSMLEPSTKARNNMLKFWNEAGGRDQVITGLSNIFGSLGKVLGSVKDAFREVFPPMTGKTLVKLSEGFKDFTERIKISDKTAKNIKDTFQGVFSVFGVVGDAFKSVISIFSSGVGIFSKLGDAALTVTSNIGKFFTNIYESLHASRIFENAANTIKSGLNSVQRFFASCGETLGNFFSSLSKLDFQPILDFLGEIAGSLGKGLGTAFEGIGEAIGKLNLNSVVAMLTAFAGKDVFKTLKDSILGIKDTVSSLTSFDDIGKGITSALSSVKDVLQAYQTDLKSDTLIKIAAAIGLLAASLILLASIKPAQMENALVAMTTMLIELVAALAVLFKVMGPTKFLQLNGLATVLIGISVAIGLLAAAMKLLSGISWDGICKGLVGIAGSMLVLVAGVNMMKASVSGLMTTAAAMIAVAAALVVMSEAVKRFGELDCADMLQGLLGVGVALVELALFSKLTAANQMSLASSAGILVLAGAMLVLQNAVAKFGEMDINSIIKGLASVAALLLEVAAFSKLTSGATGMLATSAAMVVMAGAINLMVPPIEKLGQLTWGEIAKGLTSMAGALAILGAASAVISGAKLTSISVGVAAMSAAMLLLAPALKSLGGMSWEQIAKGLVTIAGALTIFAVAMATMTTGLAGAAAVLVMSAALAVLTPQLIAMANLSWGQIAAGLAMLAGTFVVFGVAGLALGPITPVLIALAAAVALLGAGCAAAGAGVALFATGMGALAGIGAAGGYALAEILRQLINLIPQFASACGKALIEFAKAIGEGMPTLAKAFGDMLTGLCQTIAQAVPDIVEAGLALLEGLCQVLEEGGPRLIEVAVDMVIALAEGLSSNAEKLVDAAVDLVVNVLNALEGKVEELIQAGIDLAIAIIEGLADGISDNQQRVEDAIEKLGQALIDAFKSLLGIHSPSTVFDQAGQDTIQGLINGINSKVNEVLTKIRTLATDMIKSVKDKINEWLTAGKEMIGNLVSGITSRASEVKTNIQDAVSRALTAARTKAGEFISAGSEMISKIVSGISSKASEIATRIRTAISNAKSRASSIANQFRSVGTNIISSLVSGISSMASNVASKARSVVEGAISAAKKALKINSPSKVFMEIGDYTVQGFVKGLTDNANTVNAPAENLAKRAIEGVSNTVARISDILSGDIDANPVISPVMDLSNVENGAKTIRDMMAESDKFSINADATGAISRSIGNIQNGKDNADILAALKDLKASVSSGGNTTYQINGITYDDGSNITDAVATLIRAAKIERRI